MTENLPILPTKIFDNFLTNEEIAIINAEITATPKFHTPIIKDGVIERVMQHIEFDDPRFKRTTEIIRPKMKEAFGPELYIGVCNVLNAFVPYRLHTDGIYGEFGVDQENYAAYTCVLPLDDYDSKTFIFNETYDKSKMIHDYVRDNNAQPNPDITPELMEKHFTHEDITYMQYVSIETVFPWKKGSLLVASRYKFHTSDDFSSHGIPMKRAIIMWTAYPKTFNVNT